MLISVVEILIIFLVHNIFFSNSITMKLMFKVIYSVICAIMYSLARSFYDINGSIALIIILFCFGFLWAKINKENVIFIFAEICISAIIVQTFEMIVLLINAIICKEKYLSDLGYFIFLLIEILFWIIMYKWILKNKKKFVLMLFYNNKTMSFFVLNVLMIYSIVKLAILPKTSNELFILQAFVVVSVMIIINIYLYKYIFNLERHTKKIEIYKNNDYFIEEITNKFKSMEHEYKNYLNTILGIVQVTPHEEIESKINSYTNKISYKNKEISRLMYIDNLIVKSVIYNTIEVCESLGIKFEYIIKTKLVDFHIDDLELTIILNNIINNAIESVKDIKEKKIILIIEEENNFYKIQVKNTIEYFNSTDINKIFNLGFSTKGYNRGYGLYNIKKIVNKRMGKINIAIEDNIFSIVIFMK